MSVDLDGIDEYFGIHGLTRPASLSEHLVYEVALSRLAAWARSLSVPLTLFVIARDARRLATASALRELGEGGFEIASHSLDHRYDLTLLPPPEQARQLTDAQDLLEAATGQRPRGFRAPGYTVTDSLLSAVEAAGLTYDSSVFPCPLYVGAKLAVLASMHITGRRSRSIVGDPSVLTAPQTPYRLGSRYTSRGRGLLEVPIQVVGPLRLPFFGTPLTLAPRAAFEYLLRASRRERSLNVELHGIDFLDERDTGGALRRVQPDLRVPVEQKLGRLSEMVRSSRDAGFRFVTLETLAASFA